MSSRPVSARLAKVGVRKRAPSSSTNATTASGCRRPAPDSSTDAAASSAATTPSAPSYAPPSGCVSRCDPAHTQGPRSASSVTAHRLPAPSCCTSSPIDVDVRENQARASASSGLQANRFQPPSLYPIAASSPNHDTNRSLDTSHIGLGGYAYVRCHAASPGLRERPQPRLPAGAAG